MSSAMLRFAIYSIVGGAAAAAVLHSYAAIQEWRTIQDAEEFEGQMMEAQATEILRLKRPAEPGIENPP